MSKAIRILLTFALTASLSACGPSQTPTQAPIALTGKTMGTSYTVKISALPEGVDRAELHKQVAASLERVDWQMSTYRDDSELMGFNDSGADTWFEVSTDTAAVVAEALEISRMTQGAFDPTIGPLVELWNFGRRRSTAPEVPEADQIQRLLADCGAEMLEVRMSPSALKKRNPRVQLDLSAIAKGYAVDRLAELLRQHEVPGYMIEVGGELRTFGTRTDGRPWVVGIESPTIGRRALLQALPLNDACLATSGDYRNFHTIEGTRYSHTIDPSTGWPVKHQLASVSVIDRECMRADALATAMMVMGPDKAYEFANTHQLPVLLIVRSDEGFQQRVTAEFEQLLSGLR